MLRDFYKTKMMSKKIIFTILLLINFLANSFCQQYSVKIVSSSMNETIYKVSVQGFDWKKQKGTNGKGICVQLNDAKTIKINELIELPELNFCMLGESSRNPLVICEILSSFDFDASNISSASSLENNASSQVA